MRSSKQLSRALSPIVRDLRSARALPFAGTTTNFLHFVREIRASTASALLLASFFGHPDSCGKEEVD
jgi:hypothetical protein